MVFMFLWIQEISKQTTCNFNSHGLFNQAFVFDLMAPIFGLILGNRLFPIVFAYFILCGKSYVNRGWISNIKWDRPKAKKPVITACVNLISEFSVFIDTDLGFGVRESSREDRVMKYNNLRRKVVSDLFKVSKG